MAAPPSPSQLQAASTTTSTSAAPTISQNLSNFLDQNSVTTLSSAFGNTTVPANEPTSNWPFDQRIRRSTVTNSGATNTQVASGLMSTVGMTPTFQVFFLFNTTEIDIDYEFDDSVIGALNPEYVNSAVGSTQQSQGLMLNQTVSFTLLFDRTYELWTGGDTSSFTQWGPGPCEYGVQWDVWAVERLVGIYGQASGKPPSGPPAAAPVLIQFGGQYPTSPGQSGPSGTYSGAPGWPQYTGWMTSLEVEYTRFDSAMRPSRCAVAVSFEQIYSLQSYYTNPDPTTGTTGQ